MSILKHKKLLIILGPTSSGKSDLAVFLAKKYNGEIISADSRQVYKYMNIGTGKITKKEMGGIPHYLLDVAHPSRQFTVVQFKKKALEAIKKIHKKGKLPILAGGTGFYIQAVVDDLQIPQVSANQVLRNQLRNKSAEELFQKLKKLDPRRAGSIDHKNKRRLIRALEIIAATGKPVPTKGTPGVPFDMLIIGIDVPQDILNKRIEVRLDKQLRAGMIKEVKNLCEKYRVSWKRLENFGLEYKWVARYLQWKTTASPGSPSGGASPTARRVSGVPLASSSRERSPAPDGTGRSPAPDGTGRSGPKAVITKNEMRDGLLRDIKQYARRQMTWFRKDKRIKWIKTYKETNTLVKTFLHKS